MGDRYRTELEQRVITHYLLGTVKGEKRHPLPGLDSIGPKGVRGLVHEPVEGLERPALPFEYERGLACPASSRLGQRRSQIHRDRLQCQALQANGGRCVGQRAQG